MFVIATDLDRTLLPNGNQKYDQSMDIFRRIVEKCGCPLVFVTGRDLPLVEDAVKRYHPPLPRSIVAEVGTRIYRRERDRFREDTGWIDLVAGHTRNWDTVEFTKATALVTNLRRQEDVRQNRFKLSYYIDDLEKAAGTVNEVTRIITSICADTEIIYSVDETHKQGLLDVLPKRATKVEGLEYIRKKEGYSRDEILYCGDSGNDVLPLTYGYKAILVRNAIPEVKEQVRMLAREKGIGERVYVARGRDRLNGYYVSGMIEGLIHFGLVSETYAR